MVHMTKNRRVAPGHGLYRQLTTEIARAQVPVHIRTEPVTREDFKALPEAARRCLEFMNVVGRSRDWSFRAKDRR